MRFWKIEGSIIPGWCKSGTRDPAPLQSLKVGVGAPIRFKSGTQEPCSKFKSGTSRPFSKFEKETQIMVFHHCFNYYILYEKLRNFFKEIIFHESSSCPYGPLNKIMWFKLISPGFLRKDFITEDLLDKQDKLFEKAKHKRKRLSLYCWNLFMHSGIQTESYNLQMFSRSSDIKCSFVSLNYALFRIIRTVEVYSEPSRRSFLRK